MLLFSQNSLNKMKKYLLILVATISFLAVEQKESEVEIGGVKLITQQTISRDFAYCSAIIASFGDSAIFAHALPEQIANEISLPLIWSREIYTEGRVTSATAVQRIISTADSLGIQKERLSFYIVTGEYAGGLDEILPTIKHYKINVVQMTLDNTYMKTGRYRNITFNPKTKKIIIAPH